MKISFNWIRDMVSLPAGVTAADAASRLTLAGLEVESIESRGREVTGVRVAEVRGVRPHPGAEKLRIVRLSLGGGVDAPDEEVVCGAPNVPAAGGLVVWAPPGATLPGGITLGRKDIRGFESPGMICSERELGIGDGVDGILVLSTGAAVVGADLTTVLPIVDDVFEVNVTPNRSDALSHAGIAREIAALYGVRWRLPPIDPTEAAHPSDVVGIGIGVDISDTEACPRYHATIVRGVRVAPSPLTVRMRLAACGVRSISNIVDVTNHVMLEMGHPLHAFDLDRLDMSGGGGITVRRARAGETLRTLDGVDRKLETGDIVIADGRGPIALAGVMGGAISEVTSTTTNVLLESATFDPRAVRRTAKRLGLHSEASHRFERGVDAVTVASAAARAAARVVLFSGGRVTGAPVDRYPSPTQPRSVALKGTTLRQVAGFDIPIAVAVDKLRGIEIVSVAHGADLIATVPTFRPDVTIEEDLVEEVMRLVGYDQVPVRLPLGGRAPEPSPQTTADRARDILAALGLHEIAGWAFVPRAALEALGDPALAAAITVKNPISADYEVMRTSLLPGLADAARRNHARGVVDIGLFEVGPVVRPLDDDRHHHQSVHVAGLMWGVRPDWLKPGGAIDFFDVKRVVVELVEGLGATDAVFSPVTPTSPNAKLFHPGVSAAISIPATGDGGEAPRAPLGHAGEMHPALARRLGLDGGHPPFVFQISLEPLESARRTVQVSASPRFPAVTRDISFWIDVAATSASQRQAMQGAGESLLRNIVVLEDFRDPRFVAPGQKGMLWTLTYRADDRTLTDAEVDAAHARVVAALRGAVHIDIR